MGTSEIPLAGAILLLTIASGSSQPAPGQRPGDLRTPTHLKVGDAAPDFKLRTKDADKEIQLSSFKGKRPVLLVFGSYT